MGANPQLKKTLLQVVNNQLRANDPPETKQTLERLMSEGYSESVAKQLIATVLAGHIFSMLEQEHTFNYTLYVRQLKELPTLPKAEDF